MILQSVAAVLLSVAASDLDAGTHTRNLTVDGRSRSYIVYVPKRDAPDAPWPVVLVFHGGGTNARSMITFCGLNEKADEAGFLAVYPNGTGTFRRVLTWNGGNCCGYAMRNNVNDVKFVGALLDDLGSVIEVDEKRIYATGMSNGAIMCYRLASDMADRIAAIAPVAGPVGTKTCSPTSPVPVCHFHGTADEFAPYKGGVGRRSLTRTNFYSVDHSIRAWVKANGCDSAPKTTKLPEKVSDGTRVSRTVYSGGKDGAEVILYTIEGGGHTWPGQETRMEFLGVYTKDVSANDVMWDFFKRHSP